jgi:hypothetical protein
MIANFLTILVGLWLSYRAIFSVPAGEMSEIEMMVAGTVVILLALWARRTDLMGWHSETGIALGLIILALAAARQMVEVAALVSFWMILLIGIVVAITAMWSMLYRPAVVQPADPR